MICSKDSQRRQHNRTWLVAVACARMKSKLKLGTATAVAVACSVWLGCDRREVVGHKHSIAMTVTGVARSWTNTDGTVWTEIKFDQKPEKITPIYKQAP